MSDLPEVGNGLAHVAGSRMKLEELSPAQFVEYPRYISVTRFAELIGLGEQQEIVATWIESGKLPVRRFGKQILVDLEELERRIQQP
ncbi:helix-turn-helix domain-containing protein [Pseudomonas indica]|nr:helix-turn-helix domain-containing protein [Pseudomonas indica]MBU3055283.1 helix-turn-helix domain-containing protein [Pseudomonas indica]